MLELNSRGVLILRSGCALLTLSFSVAIGQTATNGFAPGPTVKRCAPATNGEAIVSSADAMSWLKQAISAMDPTGEYQKVRTFAISGVLTDFNRSTESSRNVGTFQIQEDHTVANGDFSREFVVDGVSSKLVQTAGQIISTAANREAPNGSKFAFIPKSFVFPLAVLEDELLNQKIAVFVISTQPGLSQAKSLASLERVRLQNLSGSKSSLYETEDWYFDPQNHLPVLVSHELPTQDSFSSCVVVFTHFGDYQSLSGATVPTSIYTQRGGSSVRTMTIQTLTY
jgi:hypothetical protein